MTGSPWVVDGVGDSMCESMLGMDLGTADKRLVAGNRTGENPLAETGGMESGLQDGVFQLIVWWRQFEKVWFWGSAAGFTNLFPSTILSLTADSSMVEKEITGGEMICENGSTG